MDYNANAAATRIIEAVEEFSLTGKQLTAYLYKELTLALEEAYKHGVEDGAKVAADKVIEREQKALGQLLTLPERVAAIERWIEERRVGHNR